MWKWLKRWVRRFQRSKPPENTPFRLVHQPGYLYFGYGYLPPTRDRALHYFRLRPYIGAQDPSLQTGIPPLRFLSRAILTAERRKPERAIWELLLSGRPSHVIRFGWKSLATGHCHDVFYLRLNFRFPGFSANGLAREFGDYLLAAIEKFGREQDICPSAKALEETVLFWLGLAAHRLKRIVFDGPLQRWL